MDNTTRPDSVCRPAGDAVADGAQEMYAVGVIAPVRGPAEDPECRVAVRPRRHQPELARTVQDFLAQEPDDGFASSEPGEVRWHLQLDVQPQQVHQR